MKKASRLFPCILLIFIVMTVSACSSTQAAKGGEALSSSAASQMTEDNSATEPSETESAMHPYLIRSGGYEVEREELFVESESGRIYAVLYRPISENAKMPTVIFSHGYGDTNRGGSQYALALAQQGYLVCCFDFRGGGMSSQSDGSSLDMTIFTEQADLEAILGMLQGRDEVDANNIFLLGNSQGGVISAMTAAAHPDEIAGMVLSSPAFSLVDDAKELFGSTQNIPASYRHMIMTVGREYFASVFDYDIYAAIQGYDGDVLIFHGDLDDLVPISYSEQAVEVLPNAELEILTGEGHMYSGDAVQQTITSMGEFLYEHLNPARGEQSQISAQLPTTGFITEQIFGGADGEIHYSYYLPKIYDESKPYPLMMVMPGYDMMWFGEESSGNNLDWQGFRAWTELSEDLIVVSAQLTDWGEKSARQAIELTEYFLKTFSVDPSRVYAAGYSAGGETMSQAVAMRPDLYAAYLHGASQWDGTYGPVAQNSVAVYLFMAEGDEYYGPERARTAYNNLQEAYADTGWTQEQINRVLRLEIPDNAYFNSRGIYNYHGGANILFEDETILNWIISHSKQK